MSTISTIEIKEGFCFSTIEEARKEIKKFCTINFHQCFVRYSNHERFTTVCKNENCSFKISCNKRRDEKVYISKFNQQHTCDYLNNRPKVSANFVAEHILDPIADNPEISVGQIRNSIKRDTNLKIGYMKAWRAKQIAHEVSFGEIKESFKKLPAVIEKILQDGGDAVLETQQSVFKRCYVCHKACKNALQYTLPLIFVDACHIKNEYNGVVLAACSIDGNGQTVPIAFGIVDIEDNNNWHWFMEYLQHSHSIIVEKHFSFMSDQEKGITNATTDVFPGCQQCFCVKHIEKNVRKRLDGRAVVNDLWGAARCNNLQKFNHHMENISKKSNEAFAYLNSIDKDTWTLFFASVAKFGHDTSNVVESFNQWIGTERKKSYLDILIGVSTKMMTMFHERCVKYNKSETIYCQKINNILENNVLLGRKFEVLPSSNSLFYIRGGRAGDFTVDLLNKTCSCLQFQQMHYPCVYAAATINFCWQDIHEYVSHVYKTENLKQLYSLSIDPILIDELVPQIIYPPVVRRLPGRPKKLRIRNRNEGTDSNITCSLCNQLGHNKRTCKRRKKN